MRRRITKTAVDNLRPKPRDAFLWDREITGFGCKIAPAGRKVYVLRSECLRESGEGLEHRAESARDCRVASTIPTGEGVSANDRGLSPIMPTRAESKILSR